jgi:hypothetical protein
MMQPVEIFNNFYFFSTAHKKFVNFCASIVLIVTFVPD